MNSTKFISKLFNSRLKEIDLYATQSYRIQENVLRRLLHDASNTEWGKKYNYAGIKNYNDFKVYGKVDFEEVLFPEGDCFARYMVRMREIEQSMNIIEQLIDNIPAGEYQLKMKPVIRIPEGSYYAAVEGSRGEFGVFIESRGDKFPYRMKFRSTGLPLVSCLETIARGTKIADLIAIGGTLDYVVPDIDR